MNIYLLIYELVKSCFLALELWKKAVHSSTSPLMEVTKMIMERQTATGTKFNRLT